ncbi:MAG: hypothetical protein CMP16_04450 [Rickettsiales bacterium]|nr:hypothetical protein [Rickettsiales bacterium]
MIKIIKFTLIFFLYSIPLNSAIVNEEISSKYDKIFSKSILSNEDTINYRKIFIYQEDCKWKLANKYILKINNKILIGHVLAQRYLHPKCYRSKFTELSSWLKKYNDLPQAKRIYRLAIKRMPEGYKRPVSPSKVLGVPSSNLKKKSSFKYKSSKKLSKNQNAEKRKLINTIKSRVNKGWPTGALKALNQRDTKILLDQVEIDQQKELIAKGYFLANKNKLAIKYADEALLKSEKYVPYANWTAGLASWKLQNFNKAAEYFTNFSILLKDDVWHQASGSFWAARAYEELNNYEEINFWIKRAAKNPNSFYGMLANKILGIDKPIDWSSRIKKSNNQAYMLQLPAVKRIQALIQVGILSQIENEIIKINSSMNKEVAMWSLEIAEHFNLAYTQLKIASKLSEYGVILPTKYFFPIPIWQPDGGFTIDPSLIYAFMHQESMFNTSAKSRRGAMGLMQILPSTAKFISSDKIVKRSNSSILKIPNINLKVGQEYIEYLLDLKIVDNNLIYLTAAYNGGPGNLKKWQENTNYLNDPLLFMESIPSRETRWFMEKVLTKYWIYNNQQGKDTISLELLSLGKDPIY